MHSWPFFFSTFFALSKLELIISPALRAWELILTNEKNRLTRAPRLPHTHCHTDKYKIEDLSQAIGKTAKTKELGGSKKSVKKGKLGAQRGAKEKSFLSYISLIIMKNSSIFKMKSANLTESQSLSR